MSKFICTVCDYLDEGSTLPAKCPNCGVPSTNLRILTEEEIKKLPKDTLSKSMTESMADTIALRGYNPKGVNKHNMFA